MRITKSTIGRCATIIFSLCLILVPILSTTAHAVAPLTAQTLEFALTKPISATVNQTYLFGELNTSTTSSYHEGVDYTASNGTTVKPAYGGYVRYVRSDMPNEKNTDFVYGNCVVLEHYIGGYYYYTLYAHLKTVDAAIAPNAYISTSNTIGTSGTSGNSGGPHLHFSVARSTSSQTFNQQKTVDGYNSANSQLKSYFHTNNNSLNPERYLAIPSGTGVVMGRILTNGSPTTTGKQIFTGLTKTGVSGYGYSEAYSANRTQTGTGMERWLAKDVAPGRYAVTVGGKTLYVNVVSGLVTYVDFDTSKTTNDYQEWNDKTADALAKTPITTNTTITTAMIANSRDTDYYNVKGQTSQKTLTLTLSNLADDYDLYITNSSGQVLASSTNGGTTSEKITYALIANQQVLVAVSGYSSKYDTGTPYTLSIQYS